GSNILVSAPLEGLLRIGPFSRRVGVSTTVLRAWELRYGLFTPLRTPSGYRLYTPADEARARRMLWHLGQGLAARESAEPALVATPASQEAPETPLVDAWRDFDAQKAHAALDGLLAEPDAPHVVSQTVLPDLARAADEWMRSDLGPA